MVTSAVCLVVMLAIALTGIRRARARAEIVLCANNLSEIGVAAQIYASAWEQNLPPEHRRGKDDYKPSYTFYASEKPRTPWGFSLLVGQGQVNDPRVFYCPSQTDPAFAFDPAMKAWTRGTSQGKMGYLYQVHSTQTPGIGDYDANGKTTFPDGKTFVAAAYTKVTDFPQDLFLMTEIMYSPATVPHDGGTTMNAAYADGHVVTVRSDQFVRLCKSRTDLPMASFGRFAPFLATWEQAAQ
jgi:prepilin-type processing-associated H-X9-DG protein